MIHICTGDKWWSITQAKAEIIKKSEMSEQINEWKSEWMNDI